MTSEQIAELRKLEAAASPGPWAPMTGGKTIYPPDGVAWTWVLASNESDVVTWGRDEGGIERREDGQLIVAARNALPKLLDEREALLKAAKEAAEGFDVVAADDMRLLALLRDAITKAEL